jgi:hypothetical protein
MGGRSTAQVSSKLPDYGQLTAPLWSNDRSPHLASDVSSGVSTARGSYLTVSRGMDASTVSIRVQAILTRSFSPSSCPMEVLAKVVCPYMRHAVGLLNSVDRRITVIAFSRVQS